MRLEVKGILTGEFEKEKIEAHEKTILLMTKPNNWNIHKKGNLEIKMESDFIKLLFAISEHTNENMNEISVFSFYALIDFIQEKNKPHGNSKV